MRLYAEIFLAGVFEARYKAIKWKNLNEEAGVFLYILTQIHFCQRIKNNIIH